MSEKTAGRLDRREFMLASLATAGAAAGLVAAVDATGATGRAGGQGSAPGGATVYTGDTIKGKRVVTALDVNDLAPGRRHQLYFQGVETPTGSDFFSRTGPVNALPTRNCARTRTTTSMLPVPTTTAAALP